MISNIKLILNENFSDCMKTITEISYNSKDERDFYTSEFKLYCFDSVVEKHLNSRSKSADGLYMSDKSIFFIEFKEGAERNIKQHGIKLKLFEGLNALYKVIADKSKVEINKSEFWGLEFVYIVIYRENGNVSNFSKSLTRSSVKWGLKDYEGLYISAALTEYNPEMVKHIFNLMTKGECKTMNLAV